MSYLGYWSCVSEGSESALAMPDHMNTLDSRLDCPRIYTIWIVLLQPCEHPPTVQSHQQIAFPPIERLPSEAARPAELL
jgi:hypothetical protein